GAAPRSPRARRPGSGRRRLRSRTAGRSPHAVAPPGAATTRTRPAARGLPAPEATTPVPAARTAAPAAGGCRAAGARPGPSGDPRLRPVEHGQPGVAGRVGWQQLHADAMPRQALQRVLHRLPERLRPAFAHRGAGQVELVTLAAVAEA